MFVRSYLFVPISAYNYFYMIKIIRAVRSIIPAAELTFLSLHMYLYSKVTIHKTISMITSIVGTRLYNTQNAFLSSNQQMNISLEQRHMLHFSKMCFPAEWDPSCCTHASMWFLVPKWVCRGCYNTILSLPNIGKNDISHL